MSITNEIILEFDKLLKKAEVKTEYTVISGDTLSGIALDNPGITIEDIKKINPGIDPNKLEIGQIIKLPYPKKLEEVKVQKDLSLIKTKPNSIITLSDFEKAIRDAALSAGTEPIILRGLVAAESSGNANAAANKNNPLAGALGLTQLSSGARSQLNITDPYDIRQNLEGGARWLKASYDEALRLKNVKNPTKRTHWIHALMIYHAGMGNVQKWINNGSLPEGDTHLPPPKKGKIGPLTIKYPNTVFKRSQDLEAFSGHWPKG